MVVRRICFPLEHTSFLAQRVVKGLETYVDIE